MEIIKNQLDEIEFIKFEPDDRLSEIASVLPIDVYQLIKLVEEMRDDIYKGIIQ